MINNFPLDNDAEDYADRVRISEKISSPGKFDPADFADWL
jgi:hypothetical protein